MRCAGLSGSQKSMSATGRRKRKNHIVLCINVSTTSPRRHWKVLLTIHDRPFPLDTPIQPRTNIPFVCGFTAIAGVRASDSTRLSGTWDSIDRSPWTENCVHHRYAPPMSSCQTICARPVESKARFGCVASARP